MKPLENKVVLITGAGRGIGRQIAETLAAQGAIIAANDISPVNLDSTLAGVYAAGGRGGDYVGDIANKMAVQTLFNEILDEWGRVDILINNARVDPDEALLNMDEWDWRRVVDVNLTGAFLLSQIAARVMRTNDGGQIIQLVKTANVNPAAQACQTGLMRLAEAMDTEFSAYNIRVRAVELGTDDHTLKTVLRILTTDD